MSTKIASISVALVASTLLAIACTTTTTTTSSSSSSSGSSGDAGKDSGKSTSSSSSGSSGEEEDSGASTGGGCADEKDFQSCGECVAQANQKGYADYTTALLTCICKDTNCATECETTACAATPKNPDQACNTCFDAKTKGCQSEFQANCEKSSDCVDFVNTLQQDCGDKQ